MKISELRKLDSKELVDNKTNLVQELFNLRFQLHTGRLENTAKLKTIKHGIARINTILAEIR